MPRSLAILIRAVVAIAVLGFGVGINIYLVKTEKETPQRPAMRTYPVAEVMKVSAESYQVILPSQGVVRPRTQTQLTAEVSGKISKIADAFLSGAEFTKGEVLIELDSRDYQTAGKRAQASLTRMQTALRLAEAQTEKAREDWERLGLEGEPNDLALRLPQLKEAQANVLAAQADLDETNLNVERCQILAPYNGRVIEKLADVGQFVGPGTTLGQIYSAEMFEVRLPLRDDQLAFVDLDGETEPAVLLKGERGPEDRWAATVERTDAAVDARTRQLFVIAAIDTQIKEAPPLPSGTFVEAEIAGQLLPEVFVIPRKAIRGGNSVLQVREDKTIHITPLEVVYDGDPNVVVAKSEGELKPGSRISITPLPFVHNGDQITIKGEGTSTERSGDVAGGPGRGGKGKGKGGKGNGAPPAAAGP